MAGGGPAQLVCCLLNLSGEDMGQLVVSSSRRRGIYLRAPVICVVKVCICKGVRTGCPQTQVTLGPQTQDAPRMLGEISEFAIRFSERGRNREVARPPQRAEGRARKTIDSDLRPAVSVGCFVDVQERGAGASAQGALFVAEWDVQVGPPTV